MQYCAVDEAFDNPLNKQMQAYEQANNNNNLKQQLQTDVDAFRDKHNISNPNIDLSYNPQSGIIPKTNFKFPFFNAQGDLDRDYQGTLVSDLKLAKDIHRDNNFYADSLFDDTYSNLASDSDSTLEFSNMSANKSFISDINNDHNSTPKGRHIDNSHPSPKSPDHQYFINQFINSIVDDDFSTSLGSQTSNIYDHIKSCKYCRTHINQRMKSHYSPPVLPESSPSPTAKPSTLPYLLRSSHSFFNKLSHISFGYDMKEILVIIIISVVVILIIDLFVKIGSYKKILS